MKVLCAIPSTNQMYSGVGRALKELSKRMAGRVEYTFAVDDLNERNVGLLGRFAAEHGMTVLVGSHRVDERGVDPVNEDLGRIVSRGRWDAVELIGFANAATGEAVLDQIGNTTLIYTPHDQPLWTVPMSPEQRERVAEIHRRVMRRADLVLADSPHERTALQAMEPARSHVRYLPLGCDFERFEAGPVDRPPRLLFVGDLNEIRKRFDRVEALLPAIFREWPEYGLVVVGNRSNELGDRLPGSIREKIELKGYISDEELRALYRTSRGLFLLSEVEAFGLPILEAMASGTPVFLSDLATTRSLFGSYSGARFCPRDDREGTLQVVRETLGDWAGWVRRTLADREALEAEFAWGPLAERKTDAIASSWFRRNRWSWSG